MSNKYIYILRGVPFDTHPDQSCGLRDGDALLQFASWKEYVDWWHSFTCDKQFDGLVAIRIQEN